MLMLYVRLLQVGLYWLGMRCQLMLELQIRSGLYIRLRMCWWKMNVRTMPNILLWMKTRSKARLVVGLRMMLRLLHLKQVLLLLRSELTTGRIGS